MDSGVRGAPSGLLSAAARKQLVRFGPYVLTAVVVFAILRRYPLRAITHAVAEGRARYVLPVAFAFAIVQILLTALWDSIAVRPVLGAVRFYDLARVKAGCAVLHSIGFVLNVGAYGTWIARATRVPGTDGKAHAKVAAGLIGFFAISDLGAGAFFATIATIISRVDVGPFLRVATPLTALVVAGLLLAPSRAPVGDNPSLFAVFRAVPRRHVLLQLAGRNVTAAAIVTAIWAGANAFGLPLPFSAAFAYVPLIILVGSLPVNVLGFGPVQGAWLLFLPWASGPHILAFQLTWNVSILLAYLVRGAPFVRRIMREVAEGRHALSSPEVDVQSEAG